MRFNDLQCEYCDKKGEMTRNGKPICVEHWDKFESEIEESQKNAMEIMMRGL